MSRGLSRRFGPWAVALLLLLPLAGGAAYGAGFVDWSTSLLVQAADPMLDLAASSFLIQGGYYFGELTSIAGPGGFGKTGLGVETSMRLPLRPTDRGSVGIDVYQGADLVIDWPVGTWGVLANTSFSMNPTTLTQFSATANVTAYGLSATGTFSLVEAIGGYATGLSLELSGTTLAGMGVFLAADFGALATDSIYAMKPLPVADCSFNFTEGRLRLEAFPFGCLHLDVETSFMCTGFDKTEIDFDLELFDGKLALDGLLSISTQTKSITLTPHLRLEQGCIWVNIGFGQKDWQSTWNYRIEQLVIRGLGISNVEVGAAEISMILALGQGLYRAKTASDIDLHASGYYVALAPGGSSIRYTLTDYDMVWTMEQGFQNSELAFDVYFGTKDVSLFGLALITADWTHQITPEFDYRIAVQLDPTGVGHKIIFGFNVSLVLP